MRKYKILLLFVICICLIIGVGYFVHQNKQVESDSIAKTSENIKNEQMNTLVVYFSQTKTTEKIARHISTITDGELFQIEAKDPYTDTDLDYSNSQSRTSIEQNDSQSRPEIAHKIDDIEKYDVIYIGYPIWHGQAPRIIYTFLETYDFKNKIIVPFCTSHSSDIGESAINLHSLTDVSTTWLSGKRFQGTETRDELKQWISTLQFHHQNDVSSFNLDDMNNKNIHTIQLNSGYEMPLNGIGTYSLHGDECINALKTAISHNVRLIDTASAYGNEKEVGQAIREAIDEGMIEREDIFVTTKIYPGSEMENPEQAIQDCLDRLNIGYVDLMLLHHPDPNDVKAYKAMEKYVESGQIRSIGLSNWYIEELEEFLPQVSITPALVQNEIHPYYQENDVIPYIHSLGIVVQGWYPFGGRGHTQDLFNNETIKEIADNHNVSPAQVILRWNLQKGVVVIPGSSNPDHIKENTEIYHFKLSDDEMKRINALDRNEKHDWY